MKAFLFSLLFLSPAVFAQDIFTISKNRNPENVMHFEATVKNCKFENPAISNFWEMGEEKGQKEALNKDEKKYFEPKILSAKSDEIVFSLPALKKGDNKTQGPITVRLKDCKAHTFITVDRRPMEFKKVMVELGFLMAVKDIKFS